MVFVIQLLVVWLKISLWNCLMIHSIGPLICGILKSLTTNFITALVSGLRILNHVFSSTLNIEGKVALLFVNQHRRRRMTLSSQSKFFIPIKDIMRLQCQNIMMPSPNHPIHLVLLVCKLEGEIPLQKKIWMECRSKPQLLGFRWLHNVLFYRWS